MQTIPSVPMRFSTPIKVFAAFNVILGIVCIGLQIPTIVDGIIDFGIIELAGAIAGLFYIISGLLGIVVSWRNTEQNSRTMLVSTVTVTVVSLLFSIAAIILATLAAVICRINGCKNSDMFITLEWILVAFSGLAFFNNIVLLSFVSAQTCCLKKTAINQSVVMLYPEPVIINGVNGKPLETAVQPSEISNFQQPIMDSQFYSTNLQNKTLPNDIYQIKS